MSWMHYLVGDIQGCDAALDALLQRLDFSPSRDHLHLLGDLVNRGPASLAVLRRVRALEGSATALLGNHDLHLLAAAHGIRRQHRSDTLAEILDAPDRDALLDRVRHGQLADLAHGWLLVHAGVPAAWDTAQTLALAREVEAQLRGPDLPGFLATMYGNTPARWDDALTGPDRWRFVINALTRMRFVQADGTMDFVFKLGVDAAPPGLSPWFEAPRRRWAGQPVAFGHWSTLGLIDRPDVLALDTGCLWGGCLSAARIDGGRREITQVQCDQARRPG
jgi:bis(5'-nucleosyl)-tetraphosphatase (symmetrical)